MEFLEAMQSIGVDTQTVLRRFSGMEALWRKFVLRFPEDPSFSLLEESIRNNDEQQIERQAHTLKGVAANLGFDELSQLSQKIVQLVRERPQGYQQMIEEEWVFLQQSYQKIVGTIAGCK